MREGGQFQFRFRVGGEGERGEDGGSSQGWGPEGWEARNFALFHLLSRSHFRSSSPLSGCLLVSFFSLLGVLCLLVEFLVVFRSFGTLKCACFRPPRVVVWKAPSGLQVGRGAKAGHGRGHHRLAHCGPSLHSLLTADTNVVSMATYHGTNDKKPSATTFESSLVQHTTRWQVEVSHSDLCLRPLHRRRLLHSPRRTHLRPNTPESRTRTPVVAEGRRGHPHRSVDGNRGRGQSDARHGANLCMADVTVMADFWPKPSLAKMWRLCFGTGGGFTRQPENSKRAHLSAPALQTPPKFHEKTPREREREKKKRKFRREKKKQARNFGPPTLLHLPTNTIGAPTPPLDSLPHAPPQPC